MKYFFKFLLLFCLSLEVQAQNQFVDSLQQWLKDNPKEDTNRVMNTHRLSYRFSEIDASKAWSYAKQTEELSKKIGFRKGQCLANINYAILEAVVGNFERSADYYLKAIKIAEDIKYTRGLSISYNNIGENYLRLKQYEQAKEYSKKALVLNHSIDEARGQAINLEQLGSIHFNELNYEIAYNYWQKGMEFALKSNTHNIYSQLNSDLGKYYTEKKQWDKAVYHLRKADSIASTINETLYSIISHKALANLYDKLDKSDSALFYLKISLAESIALGNRSEECEIYNLLSIQFEKVKNYDSGFYYLRKHKALGDTVLSIKNSAHLNFIQTQYETNAKDLENQKLKKEKQKQERKLTEKNWLLFASMFVILLACLSIFLVYRVLQNEKRSIALEEENKISQYNQQVAELEVMALRSQMNPHFLFNSLNSIRNFIIKNESKLASEYLANFAKLMRKILDTSQQSKIVLEDEVEMLSLYLDLELMRFSNRFKYQIHIDENLRDLGISIPSMVIQPFIENAIWHGLLNKNEDEEAKLSICFLEKEETDDEIVCTIIDNGIGREKSASFQSSTKKHKSKGIQITKNRLIKLSKHPIENPIEIIDLKDENGEAMGTKVIIHLPLV